MIIYQVYPRSFNDSNGDGIGDLNGITARLAYIKSLGVDAVWISPFFKSPMRDFGYDIADHRAVDPMFGTLDDFRVLLAHAKTLSLDIIIDMVVSHTSDQHPWFKESGDRNSPHADWYLWSDPKPDGSPPNNWISVFGGCAWQWHPQRRQYFFHSFLSSQPDLNLHHPPVQQQILDDMRFWLEQGVAGFRLDACNHYFQDLQLRDNPPRADISGALHPYGFQLHVHDQGQPEALPFLERVRAVLDEFGAFSLAEVGGADPLTLMGQYTEPGRLHSAYSFALMGPDSSAGYVRRVVEKLESVIRHPAEPCYALSNHDKPRVVSRWAHGRDPQHTAKQMLALLACLRGNICMYQGEELGLPQAEVPFERLRDPYGITFWPQFKGRDGCRTPMPWSGSTHGGFTTHEPWLPVDGRHLVLSVEQQAADLDSTLNFARAVLALRGARAELSGGAIEFLDREEGVLAFTRRSDGVVTTCLFNMALCERTLEVRPDGRTLLAQHASDDDGRLTLGVNGFLLVTNEA